jgi:DNA end-binding protein Ku
MASSVWKGHLTFGLVSIPVRLFRAARAEKVQLHQLYRAASRTPERERPEEPPEPESKRQPEAEPVTRIHQSAFDAASNTPIPRSDLVRGFEYAKGQYAVIDAEDIRKITPKTATEMQIVEFVRFAEIDPLYLETSYYMSPEEAGQKAYALLFEGMRDSGYVALAQVAMHRREHVMIIRPGKSGIVTHTMYYRDEVRTNLEYRTEPALVTPKELGLARMLIDTLAAPFDPEKFKDTYRERLRQLIEAKVQGRELAPEATGQAASNVVDIMEALQKSLAAAKAQKPAEPERAARKSAKSEKPESTKRRKA